MDGRKQRKKVAPGYATPPTVSTDSVLITATIDAHEVCNVGICYVLGAFLSAEMDKDMKMALRGSLAELIVNISLQIYRQNVIYEKIRTVLYITLKKALYGCLRFALIFYERLLVGMRGKGFEINHYDPYVGKKGLEAIK